MSARTYGTVHLYGIDTSISNGTITDESFEDVCANGSLVVDETGNKIHERMDDITTSGTVTIIMRASYAPPVVGGTFTYNGTLYRVKGVGRKKTSRGFRVCELRLEASEYI